MKDEQNMDAIEKKARTLLSERGVEIEDIAQLVHYLQNKYHDDLKIEDCYENVDRVIAKREVQNAIITGIELDILAEKGLISEPLLSTLMRDEGLYGVDEIIALSIVNVYGSIGFTNYGYIDKQKPGILEKLNKKVPGVCHTFLDDIVGAIAAAASSRLAHRAANTE
ncbi:phosphatidylglycerophosphatase A family protein [Bacillus sp. Marseille-P3661]|uniref:phosphatidylglycerophosphatase A family protein n=1 Tax=Bacillus sp. Marseille-P3661 TaxID=1936234 RepID=UPI000C8159B8|nr:phosphatidylglycerophosphatase A [Bacillus sp. Marseille-P3661]